MEYTERFLFCHDKDTERIKVIIIRTMNPAKINMRS